MNKKRSYNEDACRNFQGIEADIQDLVIVVQGLEDDFQGLAFGRLFSFFIFEVF